MKLYRLCSVKKTEIYNFGKGKFAKNVVQIYLALLY